MLEAAALYGVGDPFSWEKTLSDGQREIVLAHVRIRRHELGDIVESLGRSMSGL